MTNKDNYIFELSDQVVRKPVTYKNRYGITIAADLYAKKEMNMEERHPAVIVGPPYGGVKEQGSGIYFAYLLAELPISIYGGIYVKICRKGYNDMI